MRFLYLLFPLSMLFATSEQEYLSRVESHLSLKDYASAVNESEIGYKTYPDSIKLLSAYILALCESGQEQKALSLYKKNETVLEGKQDFLESLAWNILKSGSNSTNYPNRLVSLLTAQFSSDPRSTKLILKMMKDRHAILRLTAIGLSSKFQDAHLKDEIYRLVKEEKNWQVRIKILDTLGKLKEKRAIGYLTDILESEKSLMEEKMAAISSLVNIFDKPDPDLLENLFSSNRSALRLLGVRLAFHFEIEEVKDEIVKLVKDPIGHVRLASMYAFGMYYRKFYPKSKVTDILNRGLKDPDPKVGIMAAYTYLFVDSHVGYESFFPFFHDSNHMTKTFAAAALCHSGKYGVDLLEKMFDNTKDPCVKLNLALGLIGQRKKVQECCDVLYRVLKDQNELWMSAKLGFFDAIVPSKVRYTPILANYPLAVDQMTRLELLSLLAILDDSRAIDAAKDFLKQKNWQVKGALAVMLLREGEEDAKDVLYKLLEDKDHMVQLRASLILALLTKDESIVHTLHSFYWGASYDHKLDILEAVGHIGSKESIPFLAKIIKEPSQKIRLVAASSLIRCLDH